MSIDKSVGRENRSEAGSRIPMKSRCAPPLWSCGAVSCGLYLVPHIWRYKPLQLQLSAVAVVVQGKDNYVALWGRKM